jgi:CheY-like chemotaxis protein
MGSAPEPPDRRELRVLVVEDDPASAKLASVILRAEGCDVRVARSAEDAIAALATFRPTVILLDLVLPFMSGVLLAQRLKGDPATRDIVLIAVSAFDGGELERIAEEVGCAAFVHKPIDAPTLTRLVLAHHDRDP